MTTAVGAAVIELGRGAVVNTVTIITITPSTEGIQTTVVSGGRLPIIRHPPADRRHRFRAGLVATKI
jgi:hypothetical protein